MLAVASAIVAVSVARTLISCEGDLGRAWPCLTVFALLIGLWVFFGGLSYRTYQRMKMIRDRERRLRLLGEHEENVRRMQKHASNRARTAERQADLDTKQEGNVSQKAQTDG